MAHPPYSQDLALCDFFFRCNETGVRRATFCYIDDLLMSVDAFLRGLSADFLQTVCHEWIRRLQLCCEGGGKYVERTVQNGIFTVVTARMGDESGRCVSKPAAE
jgi:hypothetical protein